jgi:hypothetical protein
MCWQSWNKTGSKTNSGGFDIFNTQLFDREITQPLCVSKSSGSSKKNAHDVYTRYLSRFFDYLAHPNLSATLATDQKKFSRVPLTIVLIRKLVLWK